MAYYVGDVPTEDLVIVPERAGEPIDLSPFDTVDAVLLDVQGQVVTGADFLPLIVGDMVVVEWPAVTPFEAAGLYSLNLTLSSATSQERCAPVYLVAQDGETGWYTLDAAREEWADAPVADVVLFRLLELAREQVVDYGEAQADDAPVPYRFRSAQLAQARNTLNAALVAPGGDIGDGSFVVTPHPLDWHVQQIIRPAKGMPGIW